VLSRAVIILIIKKVEKGSLIIDKFILIVSGILSPPVGAKVMIIIAHACKMGIICLLKTEKYFSGPFNKLALLLLVVVINHNC
jgi:hypothetical protein